MIDSVLVPYVFPAIAAGGVANTFRFWGRWRTFATLWAAILFGAAFGLAADWGAGGLVVGVAVGGVALPIYDLAASKIRAKRNPPPVQERQETVDADEGA